MVCCFVVLIDEGVTWWEPVVLISKWKNFQLVLPPQAAWMWNWQSVPTHTSNWSVSSSFLSTLAAPPPTPKHTHTHTHTGTGCGTWSHRYQWYIGATLSLATLTLHLTEQVFMHSEWRCTSKYSRAAAAAAATCQTKVSHHIWSCACESFELGVSEMTNSSVCVNRCVGGSSTSLLLFTLSA